MDIVSYEDFNVNEGMLDFFRKPKKAVKETTPVRLGDPDISELTSLAQKALKTKDVVMFDYDVVGSPLANVYLVGYGAKHRNVGSRTDLQVDGRKVKQYVCKTNGGLTASYETHEMDVPSIFCAKKDAQKIWDLYRNNELKQTEVAINESVLTEAKSINKIQKEWAKITTSMKDTVEAYKTAEGKEKESLLSTLKVLSAKKRKLEYELDSAVGLKDADIELKESILNERTSPNIDKLIVHIESELDWNGGTAEEVTDPKDIDHMDFPKGPKSKDNTFITYSGMKGSSIAKDIRDVVKGFGAKAVQVKQEIGDNEHYYHIEVQK